MVETTTGADGHEDERAFARRIVACLGRGEPAPIVLQSEARALARALVDLEDLAVLRELKLSACAASRAALIEALEDWRRAGQDAVNLFDPGKPKASPDLLERVTKAAKAAHVGVRAVLELVAANGCDCDEEDPNSEDLCFAHRVEQALADAAVPVPRGVDV